MKLPFAFSFAALVLFVAPSDSQEGRSILAESRPVEIVGIRDRLRHRLHLQPLPARIAGWNEEFVIQEPQPMPAQPAAPAAGINAKTGQPFPRGAKPSPRYKLQAATPHRIRVAAPAQFAIVPPKLSYWYNDETGDCVTAQEAFAKAAWSVQCGLPELLVPDAEVKRWAQKYGFWNGADLAEVMDQMQRDGFSVGGVNYKDGPYNGVDYSNESILQNAIATGPVNIAIDADALPGGAGNVQGWYALGGRVYPNTDHCVALCGYGPAEFLYKSLGVTMPAALAGKSGYLLFTWSTIGFVDHKWLMQTCVEAWVRNPTTPGQSPVPPQPPQPPDPPKPPQPPTPGDVTITVAGGPVQPGEYKLVPKDAVVITGDMSVSDLVAAILKAGGKTATKPTKP